MKLKIRALWPKPGRIQWRRWTEPHSDLKAQAMDDLRDLASLSQAFGLTKADAVVNCQQAASGIIDPTTVREVVEEVYDG